jgi:hypothetical protein
VGLAVNPKDRPNKGHSQPAKWRRNSTRRWFRSQSLAHSLELGLAYLSVLINDIRKDHFDGPNKDRSASLAIVTLAGCTYRRDDK